MGNSPTRHDSSASSFRENSKQYREYRALENKIRLLKIQASNYNGIGKDAIYTDMFASVQDTVQTVWYLREKSKSSNRKIEYDMLDSELRSCLQILSSKIHQPIELNAGDRQQVATNKAAEPQRHHQQQQQKTTGVNEQLQYSLDSFESRIMQLRTGFTQFINSHGNQNGLNQLESTGKSMYKDLGNLIAPNNPKKLYLREILQDVLNDIASKQAEFYRTSKYDNLEVSSEPTDPNLQILVKMEKSLDVFRDREYLTSDNRDVPKMIDTLNCYENDLHNLRITSKDVNKKHVELLGFIGSTIQFLKENCNGTNNPINTKHNRDVIDHATKPLDPLMTSIMDELNKIQTTARQNSTNENQLTRILDLLQQVNHSVQLKNNTQLHRSTDNIVSARDGSFNETHQYHGSADHVRKAAAKTSLQSALERKGYRKTFLANTMIKQHAAKMKRTSAETVIPDPDYSLIDEEDKQQGHSGGGHRNSLSMGMHKNDNGNGWFIKPNSPMNSDLGGGSQHNSLPTNCTSEYRGSPQQSTPNSSRPYDNRSNNKAQQEIEAINRELDYLRNRVGKFNDSRHSSLYEELETLLLELLVRLERVQSEVGTAEATDLLVYSIRDTQKVLYILDEKALKF